jgi:hypothetical protein
LFNFSLEAQVIRAGVIWDIIEQPSGNVFATIFRIISLRIEGSHIALESFNQTEIIQYACVADIQKWWHYQKSILYVAMIVEAIFGLFCSFQVFQWADRAGIQVKM